MLKKWLVVFILFFPLLANGATYTQNRYNGNLFVGETGLFANLSSARVTSGVGVFGSVTVNGVNITSSIAGLDGRLARYYIGTGGYATLAAAVSGIGNTPASLSYSSDLPVSANLTIPATLTLDPQNGAKINHTTYTIGYYGSTIKWDDRQKFNGTGLVSGFSLTKPEWFGTSPNGVAFNKAISALIPGGKLSLKPIVYTTSDAAIVSTVNGFVMESLGSMATIRSAQNVIVSIQAPSYNSTQDLTSRLSGVLVKGIIFDGVTKGSNNIGLDLHGIRNSKVENIMGVNLVRAVQLRGVSMTTFADFEYEFQGGNNTNHCDYIIYGNTEVDFIRNADNIIRGWKTSAVKAHVYLNGYITGSFNGHNADGFTSIFDGLAIENSIFFGGDNILYIKGANFLSIKGNKQFQANYENTKLIDCAHVVVSGNTLSWQSAFGNSSVPGHGIFINNSATINTYVPQFTNLQYYNNSPYVITGNLIESVSGNGIYANNAFGINIVGNTIVKPNYLAAGHTTRLLYNGIRLDNSQGGMVKDNHIPSSYTTIVGARITRDHRYGILLYNSNDFEVRHSTASEYIEGGNCSGNVTIFEDNFFNLGKPFAFVNNIVGVDPENIGSWQNFGTQVTLNQMNSPRGTMTADKILTTAVNQYLVLPTNIQLVANTVYTASVYVYSPTDRIIDLGLFDGGTITVVRSMRVGPNWHRYSVSFKSGGSAGAYGAFIVGSYAQDSQPETIGTFYIWGAKIEQNAYMTPYLFDTIYNTTTPINGWHGVGDKVINTNPMAGQPEGWTCVTAGLPGVWKPLVAIGTTPANTQSDSTATTVDALKIDFNSLLLKLKNAGIVTP